MNNLEIKTWNDLKYFVDHLTDEQLNQQVRVWGEGFNYNINFVNIMDEDMINPSGDGCEPISMYATEDDDYSDEPVLVKAGEIMLSAI